MHEDDRMTPPPKEYQHPVVIRFTHWVNFIALGVMVGSEDSYTYLIR